VRRRLESDIQAQRACAGFACLLDEETQLLNALTLLLLLPREGRCTTLGDLALQDGGSSGCGKINDARSTQRIGWKLYF